MASFDLHDILMRAVVNGDAYRVSQRVSVPNNNELIVHIDPADAGGTIWLGPPKINPPGTFDYDVWENAEPGTSTNDSLFVHNMRYDGTDTPQATVTGVDDSGLDTSSADQTEQTLGDSNAGDIATEDISQRGIYRIIPTTDTISIVITNTSGNSQDFGFNQVLYEGDTIPT